MPDENKPPLLSDAPIGRGDDDRFGRHRIARRIAAEARHTPPEGGFVIALCGPWGSGKTSIANMVGEIIEADDTTVLVRFNPWMFSGAHDLVGSFFSELAAKLGKEEGTLRKVGSKVAGYAGALSTVAGFIPAVGGTASSLLAAAQQVMSVAGEGPTLDDRKRELVEALRELDGQIVVFLDDLDRLTDAEIREIVRLVKLVGDLPNVTYLLSFDRDRVEQALGAPEADPERARERGRAYLEKIVQSRHDVSPLRAQTVIGYMAEHIGAALEPYGERKFHETDWGNMLGLAFRHMVHTPRDAKRVANALPAAMDLYGDEVALVDIIGLEGLRVLEPDVHTRLPEVADILVNDRLTIGDESQQREQDRERIKALLDNAQHPKATRALLGQMFPRATHALGDVRGRKDERTERREMRVASPEVFRSYLHATLDDDALAATDVERLVGLLDDPPALRAALDELPDGFLDDAIGRLMDYSPSFTPDHAVEAANVLLALEPRLTEDRSPFFTRRAPSSWQLHSLIGHLLLSEADPDKRVAMATRLVEEAPTLSARLRALNWFGTHPSRENRDRDSEMIDEATTARLLDDLRDRVRAVDAAALGSECMLPQLLAGLVYPDEEGGRATIQEKAADDQLMLRLLRDRYGERSSQTLGEAAVRRIPHLAWNQLVELLGEDYLRSRVDELAKSVDGSDLDDTTRAALELAGQIALGEVKPDPD